MATSERGTANGRAAESGEASLGRLVGEVTADLQKLVRQEMTLAKVELRREAMKAGEAAGLYGGAGFAGYMVAMLLTTAVVIGLGHLIGFGWAAVVVAVAWGIAGAIMYAMGRRRMRSVSPPHRTLETLKEDAQLVRHPTAAREIVAERTPAESRAAIHASAGDGHRR